jgi:hypothetical protein
MLAEIVHKKARGKPCAQTASQVAWSKDKALKIARPAPIHAPRKDIPKELRIEGDCVVVGDVHADCADPEMVRKVAELGSRLGVKQIAVIGDMLNFDAFSLYPQLMAAEPLAGEARQMRSILDCWLEAFNTVYMCRGNHDARMMHHTAGQIDMDMLGDLILPGNNRSRLVMSLRDRIWLKSPTGLWMLCHQQEYSPNRLTVANRLSEKHHCHVVTHHQHHVGVGVSKCGRYVIADNGCLVDPRKVIYREMSTNTRPNWNQGFAIIKDGAYLPYVHNKPFGVK